MAHIDSYSFGHIVVDGRSYTGDILILPRGEVRNWWRLEGHLLQMEDLEEVIRSGGTLLVVGMGAYGYMRVPEELIEALREVGVEVIPFKTSETVRRFNDETSPMKAAALHLTC